MKIVRKSLALLIILVMSVSMFVGCGKDTTKLTENKEQTESTTKTDTTTVAPTEAPTVAPTETPTEVNKEDFKGEITIALPAGSYVEFMSKQIIPYFEAEYPNVKVNTQTDENIDSRIAAGDVPNILLGVFGYMPAKYAKMGKLVDFKEVEGSSEVFNLISEEFIIENFDGNYYVPWNATTQMMIYNKDLFREAGLDPENPPKTFDQYLEAARKISELPNREDGSKVYGSVMWNDALSWGGWYWTMLSQILYNFNDGQFRLFNEYGTDVVLDNPDLNMAKFFEFMQQVQDTAPPTMEKNFFSRNIGMWLQYGYGWKTNLNEAPGQPMVIGEDVGVAPLPVQNEGDTSWSTLDGRSIMIFKTNPDAEAISWEFTKFLMRDDYNLQACKYLGQLPTLKVLKDDPFFQLPDNKPFVDQLANTVPNEPIAEVDEIANIILQVYAEVVIEKTITPEEAVKKIAEEARKALQE